MSRAEHMTLERIVVGVDLTDSGRLLLDWSTRFSRTTKAEELAVVHAYRGSVLNDGDDDARESLRTQRLLDLFRFLGTAELNGMACTPIVEESFAPHRVLARVAQERGAGLLIIGDSGGSARTARQLARNSLVPLLQIPLPAGHRSLKRALKRIFSEDEPMFN